MNRIASYNLLDWRWIIKKAIFRVQGWNSGLVMQRKIPVNLDYQITTFARQPRHDRQIMAEMLTGQRLPLRFGLLVIPEDMTVRRLDFLGVIKKDRTDSNGKRLFSNVYTVRISAEVLPREIEVMNEVLTPPNITFNSQPTEFTTL